MSRIIIVHEEARFDVMDIAYSIAEDRLEASDRFVEALAALTTGSPRCLALAPPAISATLS